MQSNSKSRQQKIYMAIKHERKYLVFLSSSDKWTFPSTILYDKDNVETVIDFLKKMNIHNYNKPVYCATIYNAKIHICDINDPQNILTKQKYKWLNEKEILKLDNSNAILNSFFKKFKRNIKNKKKMKSLYDDYKSYDNCSYDFNDNENYIELKKHDYESIRSMIEKRKVVIDCDDETVKSVLDFLEMDKMDLEKQDKFICDCETVKSVLDFLEM